MIAILQNIRSLHNVGSIFRTADAIGLEKLHLSGFTPSPLDRFGEYRPQLTKVSLGAEKTVPWEKVSSATALIDRLKKDGHSIMAIEQDPSSIPYHRLKTTKQQTKKMALVVGHEIRGITPAVLKRADKILEIPMKGDKKSLNVTIAFGIVAYHLVYN